MKLNPDQLSSVNLAEVKAAAFQCIDGLQNYAPAVQPIAAALLFAELCDAYGVSHSKVLEVMSAVRRHADESMDRTQLGALREYINEELM